MEIRKNLESKKAEKSFEISAFLVFSRSDLNRPKDLAHPFKIDPQSKFFEIDPCFLVSGQTYSLAMMGIARDRYLPGVLLHACKRIYVLFNQIFVINYLFCRTY